MILGYCWGLHSSYLNIRENPREYQVSSDSDSGLESGDGKKVVFISSINLFSWLNKVISEMELWKTRSYVTVFLPLSCQLSKLFNLVDSWLHALYCNLLLVSPFIFPLSPLDQVFMTFGNIWTLSIGKVVLILLSIKSSAGLNPFSSGVDGWSVTHY